MKDLFGNEMDGLNPAPVYTSQLKKVNPMVKDNGPGPEDKKCKDCVYIQGFKQSATWHRCKLRNGGRGDHKANWETCSLFKERER